MIQHPPSKVLENATLRQRFTLTRARDHTFVILGLWGHDIASVSIQGLSWMDLEKAAQEDEFDAWQVIALSPRRMLCAKLELNNNAWSYSKIGSFPRLPDDPSPLIRTIDFNVASKGILCPKSKIQNAVLISQIMKLVCGGNMENREKYYFDHFTLHAKEMRDFLSELKSTASWVLTEDVE